jgi:hypothetical protein
MIQPILSILICSLAERKNSLARLLLTLMRQCGELLSVEEKKIEDCEIQIYSFEKVEIIVATDNRSITTGAKRNILYELASGIMVASHDDDDIPAAYYVEQALKAAEQDVDAIAINGHMTTDGANPIPWRISKDNPYCSSRDEKGNEIYLRWHNHICFIRRSIATQFKFPDITHGEDFDWSKRIHDSGLIQTEVVITKPMYHYDFKSVKP